MQDTLPLVIHNAVKDNFTRAGISRNAQSAKGDTLWCSNAQKPASPVTQTAIKDSFTWAGTNRNAENLENDTLS